MEAPDYRVGRFTLKPFRQLLDGGVPVQIGRKPLELLSVLAKAEGALVTKDELMAAVWPKSIVEENVIQVHIAALRKVLAKDAELICTVHGLGYRLPAVPETSSAAGKRPESQAKGVAGLGWLMSLAALAVILIVAIAPVFYWRGGLGANAVSTAGSPMDAKLVPAVHAAPITIAVLPFDNLSGDPGQQFFSDGITEEISAALAKVSGLQLIARTSAFQFRGDRDTRQIGKALGARYVIEGTVRQQENRVRITAHLIQTESGKSVWGDIYDRELTDVFGIQEDIAIAIANALSISLGLPAGQYLVSNRNIDPNSYQQFLQARPLARARFTGVPQAIKILEPLLKRNPGYAPGWALLASCYGMMPAFLSPYRVAERQKRIKTFWPRAEVAAHTAIRLDPRLPDSYFALARMETLRGRPVVAEDLLNKALALDPNYPDALALQVEIFANMGMQQKALATASRLRGLEPYVPTWKEDAAEVSWENGQTGIAIEALRSLIDRPAGPTSLAMMYASVGRYTEAATVLEIAAKRPNTLSPEWPAMMRIAADLLRKAPAKVKLPSPVPRLDRAGFAYLYVGAPNHALDMYEDTIKSGLAGGQGNNFSYLWHASYAPVRKTERFKAFLRNAGIVDYWRQRGWPRLCRPMGPDEFVCD
jgi:TolB-like protein/DNA-binding winged helix-turn-helix (wHTH) protein